MIETILTGVDDRCFRCGEPGHFVNDCPEAQETNERDDYQWIWEGLKFLKGYCFPPKTNRYTELNDLSTPL